MKHKALPIMGILAVLISAAPVRAVDVCLKLAGGRSFFDLRETNRIMQSWVEWKQKDTEDHIEWTYRGGEVSQLHSGFDFSAELTLALNRNLTLALGTGYIFSELIEDKTALTIERIVGTYIDVKPVTISALPLLLSGYYYFPLSSRSRLYLTGGAGTVWGKLVDREGRRLTTNTNFTYQTFQRSSGQGSIFRAGFGFDHEFEGGVRFFCEGRVRLCKISELQGENEKEETGTLFYFEEYIEEYGIWQAKNQILDAEPSGTDYRSVQKAIVDLSGIVFQIGLIFKF